MLINTKTVSITLKKATADHGYLLGLLDEDAVEFNEIVVVRAELDKLFPNRKLRMNGVRTAKICTWAHKVADMGRVKTLMVM